MMLWKLPVYLSGIRFRKNIASVLPIPWTMPVPSSTTVLVNHHERFTSGPAFGMNMSIPMKADHYISNVSRFREVLKSAVAAAGRGEEIVTLGITPHRPETGYGYICRGELFDTFAGTPACRVERFCEKPDYERALEFLSSGDYLWNSGMFVWRVDLINQLIEVHTPQLAEGLNKIGQAFGTERYEILEEVYAGLPKISVDHGILERADNVLVMPGDFG